VLSVSADKNVKNRCSPLFKIRTLVTSMGQILNPPLNILHLSLRVHSHVSGVIKSDHSQSDCSRCERY